MAVPYLRAGLSACGTRLALPGNIKKYLNEFNKKTRDTTDSAREDEEKEIQGGGAPHSFRTADESLADRVFGSDVARRDDFGGA